jgi:hypothetical protein
MCYHCANALLMLEYCAVNALTNEQMPHRAHARAIRDLMS